MGCINTVSILGQLTATPSWEEIDDTKYLRLVLHVEAPNQRLFELPVLIKTRAMSRLIARLPRNAWLTVVGSLEIRPLGMKGGPATRIYARWIKPADALLRK